ncbi:hypothetical protein niasHT_034669 [Heterodera trifolii]|uniref:Peptidylglycine monooxygenase n=1 Tax=Heterodera trifolii TaxID=157864 RepID=A0ABD2J468_9BILA
MGCCLGLRPLFLQLFLSIFVAFSAAISVRRLPGEEVKRFDIQIQGYTPTQDDDYVAVAVKAEPGYIVEFEPFAHADRVHHMLLYGCSTPAYADRNFWQGMATCGGNSHILYAWARNAPPLKLPKDVAFAVGNEGDPVQYIVLQIHYAKQFVGPVRDFSGLTLHLSSVKPRFLAGVYLFLSGDSILPGHSAFFTNMSCSYESDTKLYPFAFRTHTHQMGRVVSAFVKKNTDGQWHRIGQRNPQWPQLFQPREEPGKLVIEKGDFMAGTCRYDSSDKHEIVPMGSMGMNEMCNFYMMFYWDAASTDPFPYGGGCFGDQNPAGMKDYPQDGFSLLPPHPNWEHTAHQSGHAFGVVERERLTVLGGERLGQVAGLAVEKRSGDLWVLHRAGRVWDANTFDADNRLNEHKPIGRSVILVARRGNDPKGKLQLVAKYGRNLFYLPHGIFVMEHAVGSKETVVFTTDVGSHQVIKWHISGTQMKQIWALGEKFVPGSDHSHFCKPAGVAVHSSDGTVFVADGYCNNRVVKLSADGKFVAQFGHSVTRYAAQLRLGEFSLPHDISLDERRRRVFVADRENGRVQTFDEGGEPRFEVRRADLFPSVYSAHYQQGVGLMFVPGTPLYTQSGQAQEIAIFVVPQADSDNATKPKIQYAFRGQSAPFRLPHVLRCWANQVYVGEIANGEGVLWSLEIQSEAAKESLVARGREMLANPMHLSSQNHGYSDFVYGSSALVLLLVLCCGCCALFLLLWRFCFDRAEQDAMDRKGFKPLRSFELVEDDDELISEESDVEGDEEKGAAKAQAKGTDGGQRESGL